MLLCNIVARSTLRKIIKVPLVDISGLSFSPKASSRWFKMHLFFDKMLENFKFCC